MLLASPRKDALWLACPLESSSAIVPARGVQVGYSRTRCVTE